MLFDGAIAGSIIALASVHPSPLDDSWGYPLAGLLISAGFAFVTATIGRLETGPKLAAFKAKIEKLEGERAVATVQDDAVTRLLDTINRNGRVVRKKEVALGLALVLLALTFLGYGVFTARGLLGMVLSGSADLLVGLMSSQGQLAGLVIVVCIAVLMVFIYAREG